MQRNAALASLPRSDVELVFLGTASCTPTVSRGVSGMALRCGGSTWIFDAGEGTQIQMQKSDVRPGSVDAIFVTHAHGDHAFGLPGLLCLIGAGRSADAPPLDIYGPQGLRMYLRASLRLSFSRVLPYRVHELLDVPDLFEHRDVSHTHVCEIDMKKLDAALPADEAFGEVDGGTDISFDPETGCWPVRVPTEVTATGKGGLSEWTVQAGALTHTVPCVGYSLKEPDRPGSLLMERVMPILQRNAAALKLQGIPDPRRMLSTIKALVGEESITLPDGTILIGNEVTGATKVGRHVVILGDTSNSSKMVDMCAGCDVLVHEATNTLLKEEEGEDPERYASMQADTISHGHSTPKMAGAFARECSVGQLLLSHFSQRYKGDDSETSLAVMAEIETQAREAFKLSADESLRCLAMWDLCTVPIHRKQGKLAAGVSKMGVKVDIESEVKS